MEEVALTFRSSRVAGSERAAGLALLSQAERERYAASAPARRDGFLAGRMLLRELAGARLGIAPAEVRLTATCPECGGPHGRPVVEGSELRVSLAHASGFVVAAAVVGRAVGIDAEPLIGADPARRDAAIRSVAAGEGLAHWTRVEAVLKADGRGLRVDPRELRFDGGTARVADRATRYAVSAPSLEASLQVALAVEL